MIVPKGKKFLVGPINFLGPCLTKIITVQISGTIVGPVTLKEWGWPNIIIRWIVFKNVDGLTVQGGGIINVRGNCWCENSCNNRNGKNRPGCSKTQPHSVNFISTSNSQLKDVTVTNSPKFHVTLLDLTNFNVTNLKVDSPEDSPNTDGLHSKALRMLASETVTSGAATIVFPLATAAFTSTSMIAIADLGMESVSGLWGSVGTGQRLKKFMCKE
ncbi:polygalacturonase-like [Papaver somniferum]|uniref:polygalacturonase-like n=1 Tax=Papaver somniferum TaxID=3469 RepID=UPI000E6FDAEC|nr:polygalacturonase-like [Papaver somniferum]XP_026405305.1 polygalacturonase-like [Papaver somniferum]XP_026405306.1 polygalacturonase-like [Papaver somniferum]